MDFPKSGDVFVLDGAFYLVDCVVPNDAGCEVVLFPDKLVSFGPTSAVWAVEQWNDIEDL